MSTYPARVTEGILLGNTREIKCGISETIIGRIQEKNLGWIFFERILRGISGKNATISEEVPGIPSKQISGEIQAGISRTISTGTSGKILADIFGAYQGKIY